MMILTKINAAGVQIDDTVSYRLHDIKNFSFNQNKILLAAMLNKDNIYEQCDINSTKF